MMIMVMTIMTYMGFWAYIWNYVCHHHAFMHIWDFGHMALWVHTTMVMMKLIAQLDNLCYCSWGLCIDFHTQITRKYSTAMCW